MLVSGRVCIRNHETLFGLMGAGRGDTGIFHLNIQLGDLQIHKDVHRFPNQTVHLCILEMGHRYFLRRTDILLMVQKSCTSYQLRLVVFPIIYKVLYVPVGAGFLPSTVPLKDFWRCQTWRQSAPVLLDPRLGSRADGIVVPTQARWSVMVFWWWFVKIEMNL